MIVVFQSQRLAISQDNFMLNGAKPGHGSITISLKIKYIVIFVAKHNMKRNIKTFLIKKKDLLPMVSIIGKKCQENLISMLLQNSTQQL